ncbi:TasA family protein [Clostridium chauvoei]|nr:TasA family protein [Clostridium chauvoei]MBX7403670.1 SipW-dependent-type signal peptide-containing protein [Clostridium chauvoei]
MSKKKIVSLIAAAAVVVGVAGGTLAWFEASDTEVNNFTTGLVNIDV